MVRDGVRRYACVHPIAPVAAQAADSQGLR
jgi:hypothetical protein